MIIGFTSMAWAAVDEVVGCAIAQLEQEITHVFAAKVYGSNISKFSTGLISVGTAHENEQYSKGSNKVGIYKCPLTGEKVKYISFALPFHPSELEGKNVDEIKRLFCEALYKRLDAPNIKIPKDFDYETFTIDMKAALQNKMN